MSPYALVFGKVYLPLELQHKMHWALKNLNLDLHAVEKERKIQLQELEENQLFAYENTKIYKE